MAEYLDNKGLAETLYKLKVYVDSLANKTSTYTNNVTAVPHQYVDYADLQIALNKIKSYIDTAIENLNPFEDATSYYYHYRCNPILTANQALVHLYTLIYKGTMQKTQCYYLKAYTGSDTEYKGKYFIPTVTEDTMSSSYLAAGWFLPADDTETSPSGCTIQQVVVDLWTAGVYAGELAFLNLQGAESVSTTYEFSVGTVTVATADGKHYRGSNLSMVGSIVLSQILSSPESFGLSAVG